MKKYLSIIVGLMSVLATNADNYIKVTDASVLHDGDRVLLGRASEHKVSGDFLKNKVALNAVDAEFPTGKDTITVTNATELLLKKNGGYWNIYIGTTPIGHDCGSNKFDVAQLKTTSFSIGITSNGWAQIVSMTTGEKGKEVGFAYNLSDFRFGLYATDNTQMLEIELYVLDGERAPVEIPTSLSFDKSKAEVHMGSTMSIFATTTPGDLSDKSLTWGSTNEEVAIVEDGTITPLAIGTTKIWARMNAVADMTDTCVVTVLPATTTERAVFHAVKREDYMPAGSKVFFGTIRNGENYVMGQYVAGENNIRGVNAVYGEKHHSVEACLQYSYTVQRDGDAYIFVDHDNKYLRATASDKLGNSTQLDNYAKWRLDSIAADGSVELTNIGWRQGLYCNFSADLFRVYSGVGNGSAITKIAIYSDAAWEWDRPLRDPWMEADTSLLDFGMQEMDTTTRTWSGSRVVSITVKDLPEDAIITLAANQTFHCDQTLIDATDTTMDITVYWEAEKEGIYTGQLFVTCTGLENICVNLRAQAFDQTFVPEPDPTLTIIPDTLTIVLNEENEYSARDNFLFTATHLRKSLFCKIIHSDDTAYNELNEGKHIRVMTAIQEATTTSAAHFDPGSDYIDINVLVLVENLNAEGTYHTMIRFYSLKEDKSGYAIDDTVHVIIKVETPSTVQPPDPPIDENKEEALDNVENNIISNKILREGKVLIVRKEKIYDILGSRVK